MQHTTNFSEVTIGEISQLLWHHETFYDGYKLCLYSSYLKEYFILVMRYVAKQSGLVKLETLRKGSYIINQMKVAKNLWKSNRMKGNKEMLYGHFCSIRGKFLACCYQLHNAWSTAIWDVYMMNMLCIIFWCESFSRGQVCFI